MSEMNVSALRAMAVGDAADIAFGGVLVPVDYDPNTEEFVAKVRPLETDRIRLVPGARHLRAKDEWRMPGTRAQAHALSGVFSGRLDATAAAKAHVEGLAAQAWLVEGAKDRAIPTPMWYSGPHAPTTTVPHPHMRVLLDRVPSVEPATDEVLSILLAEGTQYAGAEPGRRPEGTPAVRRPEAGEVDRIREALRQARSSAPGGMGAWEALVPGGDRSPHERGPDGQPAGEPGRDDAERAHSGAPTLFAFQQTDVGFVGLTGSALVGSQMGSGKSILGALFVWLTGGPALIVCPNSMKYKWGQEIQKWAVGMDVVVIDGSAPQRRKQIENAAPGTVFIINYESLRAHTRLAPWGGKALTEKQKIPGELNSIDWRSVVVDEAHKIKDPSAQQTMAVKQMGLQAEHRLAMTGTPIANSPDDLWSIMNFVAPDEYGSRNQFRNRYCIMTSAWHGGFENMGLKPDTRPEFDQFFLPRFIRRTKSEVLPDLPEKATIDYRVLPMTAKQAKVYKALVEDMMVSIDGDLLMAENPLSLTIRLRQTACGVPVVGEDGNVVELAAPSNKLEAIRDILESDPGEPVVIYADSRKFIELLARELAKDGLRVGLVTGAQGATQRQKAVDAFQAGKLDVILGTLGAGAEGLTLTRARTIILAQQSWAHLTNAQAIDRVHRIGQTRGVQPIVLLSEGTIDLAVALVDLQKEGGLQQLVRDPDWMRAAVRGQVEFPR